MKKIKTFLIIISISAFPIHSAMSGNSDNYNDSFTFVENSATMQSKTIPFKQLNRSYAWNVKSITYLGRKNGGYNIRIKGVGTKDAESLTMGMRTLNIGFYTKKGANSRMGAYIFPNVKKGESFSFDVVAFLPKGMTPSTIGGFLIISDYDYPPEEEASKKEE